MSKLPRGQAAADAPTRRDGRERLKYERPALDRGVRHRQLARVPPAAAPVGNVEVEDPGAPAPAAAPSELALDALERCQHVGREELAFNQRHGIREVAPGAAMRGVEQDRRGIEQAEVAVEPGDRRFDHLRRAAEPPVRAVRANGNGIEVVGQTTTGRPEPVEGLPFQSER